MKCSWLVALTFALALPAYCQATDVVKELSHRTGMSVAELNSLLSHCESTQLSMNMCAYRDLVAVEIKMNQQLQESSSRLNPADRQALAKEQASWSSRQRAKCNTLANREVGQGSMRPLVYGNCMSAATKARTKQLRSRHGSHPTGF